MLLRSLYWLLVVGGSACIGAMIGAAFGATAMGVILLLTGALAWAGLLWGIMGGRLFHD